MVSRSLVVVTRNRLHFLTRRIPMWRGALERGDVDEVIVVDSSNPTNAHDVSKLAEDAGFRYCRLNRSPFRDTRVNSFNLGALHAKSEWIMFTSDKMDVAAPMDHAEFDRVAEGCDFMKAPESQTTRIFRRSFFLEIGGYDHRFINGEDVKITHLSMGRGRLGNCEQVWPGGRILGLESLYDPADIRNRSWNHLRYGMSVLPLAFLVSEDPWWAGRVLFIEIRDCLRLFASGGLRFIFGFCRVMGWVFAIPYYVVVQLKFGEPTPLLSV